MFGLWGRAGGPVARHSSPTTVHRAGGFIPAGPMSRNRPGLTCKVSGTSAHEYRPLLKVNGCRPARVFAACRNDINKQHEE